MSPAALPELHVTAAVLVRDSRVLAAQRPVGDPRAGLWEFPGGKIEPNESPEQCLVRELQEELGVTVQVQRCLTTIQHDYRQFRIHLHLYACRLAQGTPVAREHQALFWLSVEQLNSVPWAPADARALSVVRPWLEQKNTAPFRAVRHGAPPETH